MAYCPILRQDCPDDDQGECMACMEFITTCDRCHCPGHTDSDGWESIPQADGQPRVLCQDCYPLELQEAT